MATTADILGSNRQPHIPARWARHYQRLCRERDRLLARDCSTPQSSSPKLDELAEAGSERMMRDMSLASAEMTMASIHEVLDAIQRIERGLYGICEITGKPIEAERLRAVPWTRYSYAGQEQLEKDGYARRAGLPSLGLLSEPEPVEEAESPMTDGVGAISEAAA